MDKQIRNLERGWMGSGDPLALDLLLTSLLRINSLEGWERDAEQGNEYAVSYVQLLRDFVHGKLEESSVYVNLYEDFTARTAIECQLSEISEIRRWLRDYYTQNQIFYAGRDVYDISLQQEVHDPAAQFVVEYSPIPCFRGHPGEIREEAQRRGIDLYRDYDDEGPPANALLRSLTPINRHGSRDHYVSFRIIEPYDLSDEMPDEVQEETSKIEQRPHWINVYNTTRHYGGNAGGAWYYNIDAPLTSIYVGDLPTEIYGASENSLFRVRRDTIDDSTPEEVDVFSIQPSLYPENLTVPAPSHLQPVLDFLNQYYRGYSEGDIYSARALIDPARALTIKLEPHSAVQDPFYRPTNY